MLKSNSKKWIVGGVVAFASVGLLTTGFATWVIGTQVLKGEDKIGITVDTAKNQSVEITATLATEECFILREANNSDGFVKVENSEGAADFTVTFDTITIKCGLDYYKGHFDKSTQFQLTLAPNSNPTNLDTGVTNVLEKNKIAKSENKLGNLRSGDSWTYIDLTTKTSEQSNGTSWSDESGAKTLTLSRVSFNFGWGTFFGNEAPSVYYNKLDGIETKATEVKQELDAMAEAFKASNKAVIPMLLTLVPGTVQQI